MKINKIIYIIVTLFFVSTVYAESSERSKGISVHALPKRVAKISGKQWGLEVSYAPYLKPEPGTPFLQSINDVPEYIKKQDPPVIKNGFGVVNSNPAEYSKEELEFQ